MPQFEIVYTWLRLLTLPIREPVGASIEMDIFMALGVGVLAAACWELVRHPVKNGLVSIVSAIQRNPDINGTWQSSFVDRDRHFVETLKVKQRGSTISATSSITLNGSHYKDYVFEGTLKNGYINLRYKNARKDNFEEGVSLLRLAPSCKTAQGAYLYMSDDVGEFKNVVAIDYDWKRASG